MAESVHPAKIARVMEETLRCKKLSASASIPTRGSTGAAGYDLSRYRTRPSRHARSSRIGSPLPAGGVHSESRAKDVHDWYAVGGGCVRCTQRT